MKSSKTFFVFVHLLVIALMDAVCDDINKGPTIVEWPAYNPEADAKILGEFIKDNNKIDKVLAFFAYHSQYQRREIVKKYNTIYKKDGSKKSAWDESMNSLLERDRDAAANMRDMGFYEMGNYLAHRIRHSFDRNHGYSHDYGFISILCTSSGELMKSIAQSYHDFRGEDMGNAIAMQIGLGSDCSDFLKGMLGGTRSNAKADDTKTAALVKLIPEKKGSCYKNKHKDFYNMMMMESYDQIKAVGQKYEAEKNTSVVDKVKLCNGNLGKALRRIMFFSMDPGAHFAEELNNYITGNGDTDDSAGPRIIISRSEIDLADIRTSYKDKYKADLDSAFKDLGEYNQKLMKLLVDGNRDPKTFDSFK